MLHMETDTVEGGVLDTELRDCALQALYRISEFSLNAKVTICRQPGFLQNTLAALLSDDGTVGI